MLPDHAGCLPVTDWRHCGITHFLEVIFMLKLVTRLQESQQHITVITKTSSKLLMFSYSRHTRKRTHAMVQKATIAFEDQLVHLFPVLLLLPAMWCSAWSRCSDFSWSICRTQLRPWQLWWHHLCSRLYKKGRGKKKTHLICCKIQALCREAVSWGQQLPFAAYRDESKGEGGKGSEDQCLSAWLLSCSTSEAMQRCGYICWAGAWHFSTILGAGGRVWRPTETVSALQSHPAASQESSREFRHFPFSRGGHCFALINILYFPVVVLGGKEVGGNKTPWAVLLHKRP